MTVHSLSAVLGFADSIVLGKLNGIARRPLAAGRGVHGACVDSLPIFIVRPVLIVHQVNEYASLFVCTAQRTGARALEMRRMVVLLVAAAIAAAQGSFFRDWMGTEQWTPRGREVSV